MFELTWRNEALWSKESSIPKEAFSPSHLSKTDVIRTLFMSWEEHCVECAVPECYGYCSLYVERKDHRCARFTYGVYANSNFQGNFPFGADIRFRRWGKLEAAINNWSRPIRYIPHPWQELFYRLPGRARNLFSKIVDLCVEPKLDFDDFVLEAYYPGTEPFKLILEYFLFTGPNERKTLFRSSFQIQPGKNFHTLPFDVLKIDQRRGHIYIYPESSEPEKRLIFTWLDFVKYKSGRKPKKNSEVEKPAAKVKCLAWDLDNTLWNNTLVESDAQALELRQGVLPLIQKLDERGVIQTIISKNSYEDAWPVLERLGVAEYFVYPAINWGQKSENLKKVAEKININLDTFAFIDDSAFERNEVSQALPQIRIFSEKDLDAILGLPEFDLPITETSKTRRHSYLTEMKRDNVQASFVGSYEDFLKSCEMRLKIFAPEGDSQILRCWELIQRTNQLNLSNRRYELSAFKELLANPTMRGLAFECADKFGDYGIVGFASLDISRTEPLLLDYVLSCRVAQKRVEHAFFAWLAAELARLGKQNLDINLVVTKKNKPLRQVFSDLPFATVEEKEGSVQMRLALDKKIDTKNIVHVVAQPL